ncbi:unnamed protein product [Amaranthus hypochondriacus]
MAEALSRVKKCLRSGTEEVKGKMLLWLVHRQQNGEVCSEFEILDVDNGDLCKTPFTLFGIGGICSILGVESIIYLIVVPLFNSDDTSGVDIKSELYVDEGMFSLDLSKPEIGRKTTPFRIENAEYKPKCVSCCGKIYVFRSCRWSCFIEVFDTQVNRWKPLMDPPPVHGNFEVAYPVISDPLRGCVLLHLFTTTTFHSPPLSCIYAYYPNSGSGGNGGGRWECLDDNFNGKWQAPMVVVDGIIYFYFRDFNEMFEAYDLSSKQWLKVVLSYDSEFAYASKAKFDYLHYLGDGVLCLTSFWYKFWKFDPCTTKDHSLVYALKFKVEPRRSHHLVLLTSLSSIFSPLQTFSSIRNYLAI